jgi:malonate-semialdehyde dehydrogenase (acetylating)/methylmalonate-semialdehyde dehydrogenase
MSVLDDVTLVPALVGGTFAPRVAEQFQPVYNPSTGEVIARVPLGTDCDVDAAVQAAKDAFPVWAQMPAQRRAAVMFQYRELLEAHREELAQLITRENGKTLDEARGDVRRGIEVVEFACGIAHLAKGETLPQVSEQIDAATTREPLGVCAGITPFNFPAMVPLWMFPLAIACGNTFVLKPSEKVPLTAMRLAELLSETGLPDGVLNVVHGGPEVVEAICRHPEIAAVSFVGSTSVAQHVYSLACQQGKRVQAAGGAKNVLVVMPDADRESAVRAVMGSAFGCAGQRCMAGSLLLAVGESADWLAEQLSTAIDELRVGNTSEDPQAQMGPLIDRAALDRVTGYIEIGLDEGANLLRDGRNQSKGPGFFLGPTLLDQVRPEMRVAREEIFGPLLSMLRPASLEQAIDWANASGYGNGATIFTQNGAAAREFSRQVQCGMVGINVGVPAPMALFSFCGWNRSFLGDLHVQGAEGVLFYTRQKVVLSRWDDAYRRHLGW